MHRQSTFIAPILPRGGLLGGSSDSAPKMSKLQALAAARKKKAQEQKPTSTTGVEKPLEGLSLQDNKQHEQVDVSMQDSTTSKAPTRGFPLRKRKDSNPHEKAPAPSTERELEPSYVEIPAEEEPLDQAQPSAFANAMFSNNSSSHHQHHNNIFSLPYAVAATNIQHDPFAGPSPDDVVIAAQSKGSAESVRPQKQN